MVSPIVAHPDAEIHKCVEAFAHSMLMVPLSLQVTGQNKFQRISGTSVGGGTFWGLAKLLTDTRSWDDINALTLHDGPGDNKLVDLLVGMLRHHLVIYAPEGSGGWRGGFQKQVPKRPLVVAKAKRVEVWQLQNGWWDVGGGCTQMGRNVSLRGYPCPAPSSANLPLFRCMRPYTLCLSRKRAPLHPSLVAFFFPALLLGPPHPYAPPPHFAQRFGQIIITTF